MINRRTFLLSSLGALTVSCAASMTSTKRPSVRISTGLPGMTFKPLGEALVSAYSRVLPDIEFIVVETPGSLSNLQNLEAGRADLGLALADVTYMAFNNELSESAALRGVRGMSVLHPSRVHVLVRPESSIQSLSQLRGRDVAVGPPGSGTAVTSELVLRAFDVRLDQVRQHALPFADLTRELTRGSLECAFVVSADPVDAVGSATAAGARLLEVKGPTVSRLRTDYPFLRSTVIPGGLYTNHPDSIETVADDVLLVCRATMDELLVRRLTVALFDVLPQLALSLDYLRLMDIERSPATPIPLHAGAAWYYREAQLER